jgi:hypothetical protein
MADQTNERAQAAPSNDEPATAATAPAQEAEPRTEAEVEAAFDALQKQEQGEKDAPKQPDEQEPADEQPEGEQEPPTEGEEESMPNRIRLGDLQTKDRAIIVNAVQMVRDGLAENVEEAIAKLLPQEPAPSQEADTEAEPDPYEAKIAEQEQEIEAIRAALTKAKEDFDTKAELELVEALGDAKSEIKLLKFAKEQDARRQAEQEQQAELSAYESTYQQFRDQANDLYPDGGKPGTPMFEEVQRTVAWFEANNPQIFQTPNYPLAIAGIAAANLAKAANGKNGSQPTATKPRVAAQSPSAGPARGPARPTDVLVGDDATSAATNAQNFLAQLDGINNEQDLDALAEAVFAGR